MTQEPVMPDATQDDLPPRDHNNPPETIHYDKEAHEKLTGLTAQYLKVSDVWVQTDVNSETLAGQLADQITGLRDLHKAVEAQRVTDKKPHDDAGKAVQAAYKPLLDRIDASIDALKPILAKYAEAKAKREEQERQKRIKEAEAKAAEAALAQADAEKTETLEDKVKAEEAKKAAEKEVKRAAKPVSKGIQSASGAGRTVSTKTRLVVKQVTNIRHLFMHYQNHPDVADLLSRLATNEANKPGYDAEKGIPGVTFEKKTIVS